LTLSIDIETFSSVDLSRSGVYKYAESPDFEILLFGYSVDGGPVRLVDFTDGEELPPEIVSALLDDKSPKWAFNCSFERTCIARYLRDKDKLAEGEFLRDFKDPNAVCCGIGRDVFNAGANAKFAPSIDEELQPTMTARGPGAVSQGYIVRRLIPLECCRLQGFPDWWCADLGTENPTEEEMAFWRNVFETHRKVMGTAKKPKSDNQIRKWLDDPHTDGAEYKMWGNGVALPCVYYVMMGIAHFSKES
jgi:hypothetical protein